jgi:hypothetical protein
MVVCGVGAGVPALQAEMQTLNNESNKWIRLNVSITTNLTFLGAEPLPRKTAEKKGKLLHKSI